jgi:hypothetical protein
MLVTGRNDPFTCLGPLNAKDLFQSASLKFIRGLLELELPLRLGCGLLFEYFHQLQVKLVPLAHDYLLGFLLGELTTVGVAWCHDVITLVRGLVGRRGHHILHLRSDLHFGSPL